MIKTKRVLSLLALVLSLSFVLFAVSGIAVAAEDAVDAASETLEVVTEGDAASTTETESKGLSQKAIINLIIGGVLLVILIVLCIVFRRKIPGWFRSVKSECKKIVWCPKEQLKHSSIVVIVTIVALVIAIFALDQTIPVLIGWANTGIDALVALVTKK